ncbi:hypothetical protein GOQ30_05375 [Flavobacterium sp. TP390]|uniref:TonB C-terminal domain-containing protein n=1 Tax=Flavobacterium profundi TaxID=1774945 RepID=A0A6I4IKP6_9FLAO|nr:hypothetical protein [Flavobacterium profundi]MVO08592.1 hypothetical protein [Flavobacterium profundi]
MKLKNNIQILLLLLFCLSAFSQKKTYLDFMNERTVTFPGCENARDKSECYRRSVGEIILKDLNTVSNFKKIGSIQEVIEIQLLLRTEISGETTVLKVDSKHKEIDTIVIETLKKLPQITPIVYLEPKSSSFGFYVVVKKNNKTGRFEWVERKSKTDLSKEPYPVPNDFKHAAFKNCDTIKNDYDCFVHSFTEWLVINLGDKIDTFKKERFYIQITIDEKGNLEKKKFTCNSETLKNELEKLFEKFPKLIPAEMKGKKTKISYSIPVTFQ